MSEVSLRPPDPQGAPDKSEGALAAEALATDPRRVPELEPDQAQAALDWFIGHDYEEAAALAFDLNVAPVGKTKKWIRFEVQGIDPDLIDQFRRDHTDANSGRINESRVNLAMAVAGLLSPNMRDPRSLRVRLNDKGQLDPNGNETDLADAADVLKLRFAHKPGLIDRIGQKVLEATGYDLDDVREAAAGKP